MRVDPQAQCEPFQSEYLYDSRPSVSRGHGLRVVDDANGVIFPIVGCMVSRQAHLTHHDDYERRVGRWAIARRRLEFHYITGWQQGWGLGKENHFRTA